MKDKPEPRVITVEEARDLYRRSLDHQLRILFTPSNREAAIKRAARKAWVKSLGLKPPTRPPKPRPVRERLDDRYNELLAQCARLRATQAE